MLQNTHHCTNLIIMRSFTWLITLPMVAEAGEVLWSGFFNESATVAEFDNCRLNAEPEVD